MKNILRTINLLFLIMLIASCNSGEVNNSASNEKVNSSSSCYDADMSAVCQKACGVSNYTEDEIVEASTAKEGDITKCLVSGAIYKIKNNSPVITYNDKVIHTCCATCAGKFKANPEKFAKNI